MDAVVEEMRRNIRVHSSTVSSGGKGRRCGGPDIPPDQTCDVIKFVIEFEYSDSKIAQEVNEKLVWLFMDAGYDFPLVAPEPQGGATFGTLPGDSSAEARRAKSRTVIGHRFVQRITDCACPHRFGQIASAYKSCKQLTAHSQAESLVSNR